jgi:hypothetical protein
MVIESERNLFILFLNQTPQLNITLVVGKVGLRRDLGRSPQDSLAQPL